MFEKQRQLMPVQYIERLIYRYQADDLASMSAQIAYYLILAFFPFLIFLINVLSFTSLSSELLLNNFIAFLPKETGVLVKDILVRTVQAKSTTLLFFGILTSLWAGSRGIAAIIRGLNKSYEVDENRNFFALSLVALISTVGVTIVIIFNFGMIIFGKIVGYYIFGLMGAKALFHTIWSFLRYLIPVFLMLIAFSFIYKYLPNRKFDFKNIIVGAIFATVGWITISLTFSFYVNNFAEYEKVYGSIVGVIALIIWLYISALIILLGGELIAISSAFENKENKDEKEVCIKNG